jgi:hypothetical protein
MNNYLHTFRRTLLQLSTIASTNYQSTPQPLVHRRVKATANCGLLVPMKNNVPILALLIGYLGAVANFMTEAKSAFGAFAALASFIASLYAIAIARQRLKNAERNPFAKRPRASRAVRRSSRRSRLKKIRKLSPQSLVLITLIACAMTGCSTRGPSRTRTDRALTQSNERLAEQSRALTTAVVDSLNVAPQNPPTNLARRFAIADQEIEGLPLKRIPATAALAGDPKASADIEARFTEINSLRAHNVQLAQALRDRDAALMELGEKYEAEKNKTLWRRIKTALIGTFGISGLIALCVFCPAVIPIITRGLALIVSKVPQLAGALGVVGKDAFDAVVKAVGHTRDQLKSTNSDTLHALDSNLRAETDADHKALINQRRAVLNV